ncbi:hypothetical protein [Kribbella rubisoli]|uniref:hypothetical protein n=1 Tax=Kribbella rubisoli TaxID=3075929 RepID=UPI001F543D64|nr:hypothetical protein [Kribbella rubisoli]
MPTGVSREGIALAPDEGWERGLHNAGVEDPRVAWISSLGRHVMTYVAYGSLGPKPALAVLSDLRNWERLGQPDGEPSYAMLHRPMSDLSWFREGEGVHVPAGVTDDRPRIWVSFVAVSLVEDDVRNLVHLRSHRLMIHHGVTGKQPQGFDPTTQKVVCAARALLLDASDVVFPTAIEQVDGVRYVFYGMADSKIGVARLDQSS